MNLQEVLTSIETISVENINKHLPTLSNNSKELKADILKYLEEIQENHAERPKKIKDILTRSDILVKRADTIKEDVNEIKNDVSSTRDGIQKYVCELSRLEVYRNLCNKLCYTHEKLLQMQQLKNDDLYVQMIATVQELRTILSKIPDDEKIDAIKELNDSFITNKHLALGHLNYVFKENISYENSNEVSKINIAVIESKFEQAVKALFLYEEGITPLDEFVRFLWEHVFMSLVNNSSELIITNGTCEIRSDITKKNNYEKVYKNLTDFVGFLHIHLSIELKSDYTILNYIGDSIRDNLIELVIKFCLNDTIPSTEDGLKQYSVVIESTQSLQNKLVETGLFKKDSTLILDYAKNVDIHFINKKCQTYNVQAMELMKMDLHDLVTVGNVIGDDFMSAGFPQCKISKSVLELIKIVDMIMVKATNSSEVCAGRLFTTAKNILYRYDVEVKKFHQKLLQTIPQQIAIFYNNCMYLSYEFSLEKWIELYRKLPQSLRDSSKPFEEVENKLADSAIQTLEEYRTTQSKQIEVTIQEAGISALQSCDKLDPKAEKAIRQCLRLQELLKTVWQKVLNDYEYNKTLGLLLDDLCGEIIKHILIPEDISAEAATQLVDLLKLVLTRGPKLFTDPREVNIYVAKNWQKFSELMFVLHSSLLDIDDRWADGKGPLALQFTPTELKSLVRALFQNTERRAAVLAHIRDC